ncbi:MAG TPA: GGDEF domain-containing protein [Gaiellaceae bacterium]|nr:GGDEF domain-containing protein [Gaiellaceae bacterium]
MASIEGIVAAAGAADLFLFRKIGDARFAHIGGVGRGEGWAGIVEVGLADEQFLAVALETGGVTRRTEDEAWHVFGPYYSRSVAVVNVSQDVFAVFGARKDRRPEPTDEELLNLATLASDALSEVAPAKKLADELEVLNALRDLLLAPAGTFAEALHSVVARATSALSCDLGVVYTHERKMFAVSDPHGVLQLDELELRRALEEIDGRGEFPVCIQDASLNELPPPFSSADGTIAYYLLELEQPIGGFLLLMHTEVAPRGFTLLCQTLGERLVDAARPFLVTALSRDGLRTDLERASGEARRDVLTGVANRLAWDEALANEAGVPGRAMSIVQLDCRALKRVNDTHGHHAGDRLLQRAAEIITSAVRGADLVARIGGDEFAILLRGAGELVAAMIVDRIEGAVALEPPVGAVEVAFAIGWATTESGDLAAAQRAADAQMLTAKEVVGVGSLEN